MSDSLREPVRDWAALARLWAGTEQWAVPTPLREHLYEMANEIERLRVPVDFGSRTRQAIRRRRDEE